ncbi:MAG: site-2 protease family protein [Phycisphaerales bacterium]|jgi:regulator of sigma E protease|nr:site-2 protease family protein [Phycisphaerales bacterium]
MSLVGFLSSLIDLLLVIVGFGLIIFLHELGHFVAARWAGIRVLAFAIGFGPAMFSWRKGIGLRAGSSETEALNRFRAGERTISPTEYRLNWLPFGGYVKMLGQDDADPTARSDAPDSYQSCVPWKRMIVISAGVVANLITAAILFVIVFSAGLKTEPAKIGAVFPGAPAASVVARNAAELGVAEPGLRPGDEIVEIDGDTPRSFQDIILAAAMAERDVPVEMTVKRPGLNGLLSFRITPEIGPRSGLLEFGFSPARSAKVFDSKRDEERADLEKALTRLGLAGVKPGMTLTRAGDIAPVRSGEDLERAIDRSAGAPVELQFSDGAASVLVKLPTMPSLQESSVRLPSDTLMVLPNLLGLTPVMTISPDGAGDGSGSAYPNQRAESQGFKSGDIFVRIGAVEFPSLAQGIAEIKGSARKSVPVTVARAKGEGYELVDITAKVDSNGTIGFQPGDTAETGTLLALPPASVVNVETGSTPRTTSAAAVITRPGMKLARVAGTPVANLLEAREALRAATKDAAVAGQDATVSIELEEGAFTSGGAHRVTVDWRIDASDVKALHALTWAAKVSPGIFEPEEILLKGEGPIDAIRIGLGETHRVMLNTYVTFARLFQGTVKIEHLKGPVGIAHLGSKVASRGFIWLLFFLALISVNLAVVNFMPLPIADGGQFLFILAEQIRGKPVPAGFQNATMIAGLLLIAGLFLILTYNDIVGILKH